MAAIKGHDPTHLSIFCARSFQVSNKGTVRCAAKPSGTRLAWNHRETLPRELGAHLVYSWRERAKPLRGRAVAAHVVYRVFYVLCVVLCLLAYYILYFLANQLVEIDPDKGQISKVCATVNKKPPQKKPCSIRCASVE